MKKVTNKSLVRNIILVAVILGFIIAQIVGSMRKVVAIVVAPDMTVLTNENDTLYISLSELNGERDGNQVGYAYLYGTPQRLWNMAVHPNAHSTEPIGIANNLYCAQAKYGYSWEKILPSKVATYPISYSPLFLSVLLSASSLPITLFYDASTLPLLLTIPTI